MLVLAVLGVFSVGCKKETDNSEAVKQGVMRYLAKRNDLGAMEVSVASVQFRGNEADAKVHFQAKNNTSPAASMEMVYAMERKGDAWVVKGRSGAGAGSNPHGGGALPSSPPEGSAMPPGHPSVAPSAVPPSRGMPELPELPKHK